MVKNLPSNVEDAGSIPGPGTKISYAMGQLSPRTTMKSLHTTKKDPVWQKLEIK